MPTNRKPAGRTQLLKALGIAPCGCVQDERCKAHRDPNRFPTFPPKPKPARRRKAREVWPPPVDTPKIIDGVQNNRDGEPMMMRLIRYGTDRSARAVIENGCCNCDMRHLMTFEVFRAEGVDGNMHFYLIKRAYRLTDGRPVREVTPRRRGK